MNFRRKTRLADPEINFIPLIDVLLVIIIFLVVSTTFSKFSELKINLPVAEANQSKQKEGFITIIITREGKYSVNEKSMESTDFDDLVSIIKEAAQGKSDTSIIINADALTTHQAVVNVMEASRLAGLNKITFSTKVQ
ncbi:MAG: biopolymer transporter ExbD [Nitrosomonadales bacterium]|jgi:biopolymer transport protein ExbD|nr:MAG: biopolymer transporter ExbD [Methylophilales bacterium BACL14 MAG-120910-bin43]KRP08094.1 MAG: biopolymer transporter ExbD [Methylophilales bacterium BACL14 MAG-120920-bin58]MBT6392239.1 biopolymer transporter ExbD [Nitrosomonadales bacterium]|tara:strand:- start:8633 stop:9046 length:414 start_codon:yes stop_codon:yes gene_type:complete